MPPKECTPPMLAIGQFSELTGIYAGNFDFAEETWRLDGIYAANFADPPEKV